FSYDGFQRTCHIGRLVQLVADFYVVWHEGPEVRQAVFDLIHHCQRGRIGTLGDGYVNRSATVHKGIAGWDIGAVLYGADIVEVDGWSGTGSDRQVSKGLNVWGDRITLS